MSIRLKRKARRMIGLVAVTVVGFYVVWALLLYTMQDKLVFPAGMAGSGMGPFAADLEVLTRPVPAGEGGGSVEAWWWPHPDASPESPRPIVAYFHGNAELIDYQAVQARLFRELGFSVLLVEYRGYGRSGGHPSEAAIVGDAVAFLDEVMQRTGVDRDRLVVHGRSIGGSVAVQVAGRLAERGQEPSAIVLETSTPSVAGMAWRYGLPPAFVRHPFRSDRVLPGLNAPVLVIAADEDKVFPLPHSQRLAELAPNATLVTMPGRHNTFIQAAGLERYRGVLSGFLNRTTGRAGRPTRGEPASSASDTD